ncbi:DNA/RNA non-specific endonuclease [Melittangium boletus]|uniref:DNA/RNA non-specific endonuclease n=1 Tax=Melittangium boletus TaxID=83453 RepID=UPI003DA684F0
MQLRPPRTSFVPPREVSVKVGNTVPAPGGSWARAAEKEVPIAELQRKFGWAEGSWQADLLRAADGAATSPGERRGNGGVSAAEVERYLAEPDDARFLTSAAIQGQRAALDERLGGGRQAVAVDGFDSAWQNTVAHRADTLAGNGDGQVSRTELNAFLTDVKDGRVDGTAWMPDQREAVFASRIAESAGEADPLRPLGEGGGLSMVKEYMRTTMGDGTNVPTFVSYLLSAADIQETPAAVNRSNSRFQPDPELGRDAVVDSDYTNTGYDRGHMKPADDSPTQEAMDESHLLSNVAPQHPDMNRQTWRTLEAAINDLVESTGGKASILTGNLYLDAQGKPLPPEARSTTGANARRIDVPTHQFKTVLLELPNGNLSMFAYVVPNIPNAPTKKSDITPFLEASRTSVDRIEELLGQDLYAQLPPDVQETLEKDTSARVRFRDASLYEAASLVWPQGGPRDNDAW